MFELFKKDIKVGNNVKLYLTSGKEPEGKVLEIGENFVLIEGPDNKINRLFDKLIGGWDLIIDSQTKPIAKKGKAIINKLKVIEKDVNNLIQNSLYQEALVQIENEIASNTLDNKYKSSLLLKKAQIFSSLNEPNNSEIAYKQLILFNEEISSSHNNLSHLYTELARLQSTSSEKIEDSLSSIQNALKYNPNNQFASNLYRQIELKLGKSTIESRKSNYPPDNNLAIEIDDQGSDISKLIDIDIKEHKYTHPDILKNGGKSTAYLAKNILEQAKSTRKIEVSGRYPLYLEAAKAFSELNIGSYDLQDYQEAVAYYSLFKGNALYFQFKEKIIQKGLELIPLLRLKDSACSYYIEALNVLSNINPKSLLIILADYLKMNISTYHIEQSIDINYNTLFKQQFADVFKFCLKNKDQEIEKIAYKTILSVGTSSTLAWNQLASLEQGTGRLYHEFYNEKNRLRIYALLNKINHSETKSELGPKDFLKQTFKQRRNTEINFLGNFNRIIFDGFDPGAFSSLKTKWDELVHYEYLLNDTDLETKNEVEKIILIVQPYLNRNKTERTNILLQSRSIVERQIRFINQNTTFFGRSLFYGLLSKWKKDIDALLDEKIAQAYPALELIVDPPYYINYEGETSAQLVIKNIGETTSEGFYLLFTLRYPNEQTVEIPFESDAEISAGTKIETSIIIPKDLVENKEIVELQINAQARYQNKLLMIQEFQFTIEVEPESALVYDDIPWRDGPIPPEFLFKGRRKLIADLAQHYLSVEKDKPYILYGLTRTGKSSVMEYLRKNLEGDSLLTNGREKTVITFSWELSEAASQNNAQDFYYYILYQQTFEIIENQFIKDHRDISGLKITEKAKFKDFKTILDFLDKQDLYPIFFVDEFSFIKLLIDNRTINSAFLHSLRQFSLNGLASFIFSGTYDIKGLIKDPKYGITGQLVNAVEYQINEISNEAAEELINVIDDKLSFTETAVKHIQFLSGNIPYFIQIICKYCGYYASENKRRVIGYPELEKVVRILVGRDNSNAKSFVKTLSETTFQNNQFSPADPKEVFVLISSIAHFNKDELKPRGVGFHELQKLWADKNLSSFRSRLADAIEILKEKKILVQEEDEFLPTYKFSVDLFRRWWSIHNPDINLILTTLTSE